MNPDKEPLPASLEAVHYCWEMDDELELPEEGAADFGGSPHYFWFLGYRHLVPRSAYYELSPISEEAYRAIRELAAIWRRWELAYHGGDIALETWPAIPDDKERSTMLRTFLDQDRRASRPALFEARGTFNTSAQYLRKMAKFAGRKWPCPGWHSAELEVIWSTHGQR